MLVILILVIIIKITEIEINIIIKLFLYNLGTAIKQAKSGELPPQPSKPQQQAQQPAALAVPQVAICPATPAVNESELIVSSQQHQSSTSAMSSSSSVTTVQQGGK